MFSKYKKTDPLVAKANAAPAGEDNVTELAAAAPEAPRKSMMKAAPVKATAAPADKEKKRKERLGDIKLELHKSLLDNLNLAALENASEQDLKAEISSIAQESLDEMGVVLNREERQTLNKELFFEVKGLGPLETLLQDESVNDILVNGPQQIFVERDGRLQLTDVTFKDEKHLLRIIDKIVSAVGRRVDESNPYVDARLGDGSRFNAMVPPIAVDGSLVSIRKFKKDKLTLDQLVKFGAITPEGATILQIIGRVRCNIIISGGTGSGKTTLLNCLTAYIDSDERIITCEDSAELQLQQPHVVRLETRPPNIEGKGEITQRDLVRNSLRMRPERIVLGEVRGGEALDMLQAAQVNATGFARFFDELDGLDDFEIPAYLSTHPVTAERAEQARGFAQSQSGTRPILSDAEWQALRNICR